jgi:hypothetical protein
MLIISIPSSRNSGSISENADDQFDSFTSPPQKSGKGHTETANISLVGQRQKLLLIGSPALENLDDADPMVRFLRWQSIDRFFPEISFYRYRIWLLIEWAALSQRPRKFTSLESSIFASPGILFHLRPESLLSLDRSFCSAAVYHLTLVCLTPTKPTNACLRTK